MKCLYGTMSFKICEEINIAGLFMLWTHMDMGRRQKSNPEIREAFSFEDELFSLITQLLINCFKSLLAMWSSQNIKGQSETGCPFCGIVSDLSSKPTQRDIKQIQAEIIGGGLWQAEQELMGGNGKKLKPGRNISITHTHE